MKIKKFGKRLMLKKVTIADLNRDEMNAVLGGQSSCPCEPAPTDDCDILSHGSSCDPTVDG
jgi:natural product precursor